MNWVLSFWILGTLIQVQVSLADDACPYLASDAKVQALAQSTEALIRNLQDSKDYCGQTFVDAVKSVNTLPAMLKQLDDPASVPKAQRDYVTNEIAKAMVDPSYANMAYSGYANYLDYLMQTKITLDQEIATLETSDEASTKVNAKKNVISMTSNLLGAVGQASKSQQCRQYLSEHTFGQLSQVSLGVLSASSPLLFSSGIGAGVGIAAGLLSDIVNMINSIPPKALREWESMQQTLGLACVYHATMSLFCGMKENALSPENVQAAQNRLRENVSCIPRGDLYNQFINSQHVVGDLQQILLALSTTDPTKVSSGASQNADTSGITNDLDRLQRISQVISQGPSDKERLQILQGQFEFFDKNLITNPSSFDQARSEDQQRFMYLLRTFLNGVNQYLGTVGQTVQLHIPNGPEIPPVDVFKQNRQKFISIIQKKFTEVAGTGASDLRSLESPIQIHSRIDLSLLLRKLNYLKKFYARAGQFSASDFGTSNGDWNNFRNLSGRSDELLSKLEDWAKTDRRQFGSEEEYQAAIQKITISIREDIKKAAYNQTSDMAFQTALNDLLQEPLIKFSSILSNRGIESQTPEDPFSDPFKQAKPITEFERFALLREVSDRLKDSFSETNDRFLLEKTRKLFETSELRDRFSSGLEKLIEGIKSDPDQETSRHMAGELCGLALSLPKKPTGFFEKSSWHPIRACEKLMPKRMASYYKEKDPSSKNECSYMRYFQEKTREDAARFGRKIQMPLSSSGVQKKVIRK